MRDRGAILKKLDQLERPRAPRVLRVGTGSAFDVTVDAVTSWVDEAKKRGIEIVPVSAVAIDPENRLSMAEEAKGRSIRKRCPTGPASASWC